MIVIEKRGLHLPMDEQKLVKVQGCSLKRNARGEQKRLQTTERLIYTYSSYQEMKGYPRKYKMNTQILCVPDTLN